MKNNKAFLSLMVASFMAILPITSFAQTTGYVMKNSVGAKFQFNLVKLGDSYEAHQENPNSPAATYYKEYMKLQLVGFVDDKRGYIDIDDVTNAYEANPAGIITYMETQAKNMPNGTVIKPLSVNPDGSVKEESSITIGESSDFEVISITR